MGRRSGPLLPVVLLGAVAVASSVAGAGPAAADCQGATIEYAPLEVEAGGPLTVRGTFFGSKCYDTGPPPPGQGVLGKPLRDIEILVTQGEDVTVVARGAADDDYSFEVTVAVPSDLVPGEATIAVRRPDDGFVDDVTARPVRIVVNPAEAGPAGVAVPEVATFGPDLASEPVDERSRTRRATSGGPGVGLLLLGAVLLILLTAGFVVAVAAATRGRAHVSETGPR